MGGAEVAASKLALATSLLVPNFVLTQRRTSCLNLKFDFGDFCELFMTKVKAITCHHRDALSASELGRRRCTIDMAQRRLQNATSSSGQDLAGREKRL